MPIKITVSDVEPFAQSDEERELQDWLSAAYDRAWDVIGRGSCKEKPPFLVLDGIGTPYYDGFRVCIPTELVREARAGAMHDSKLFSGASLPMP